MGLLDPILGRKPSSTTTQEKKLTPEQEALFTDEFLPGVKKPVAGFEGPTVAPLSDLEKTSLSGLEEQAARLGSGDQVTQDVTNLKTLADISSGETSEQARGALGTLFEGGASTPEGPTEIRGPDFEALQPGVDKPDIQTILDVFKANTGDGVSTDVINTLQSLMGGLGGAEGEKAFEEQVQAPLLREFEEKILPQISRQFAGQGFRGTERRGADTAAQDALLRQLVQGRSKFVGEARESAAERALGAAQTAGGFGVSEAATEAGTVSDLIRSVLGEQTGRTGIDVTAGTQRGGVEAGLTETGVQADVTKRGQDIGAKTSVGDIASRTLLGEEGVSIDASEALGMVETIRQQGESTTNDILTSILDAGGLPRQITQAEYDINREIFDKMTADEQTRLNLILKGLGIPMFENITTVDPGSGGLLETVAGPIAGAATTFGLGKLFPTKKPAAKV